jgi:3-hydroxyisobutyryl-CoA hydrolase
LAKTILLKGAGEKAFCAGGDVAAMVTLKEKGATQHEIRKNYFREEYTLDYYLSIYEKPIVAIIDGITSIAMLVLANL